MALVSCEERASWVSGIAPPDSGSGREGRRTCRHQPPKSSAPSRSASLRHFAGDRHQVRCQSVEYALWPFAAPPALAAWRVRGLPPEAFAGAPRRLFFALWAKPMAQAIRKGVRPASGASALWIDGRAIGAVRRSCRQTAGAAHPEKFAPDLKTFRPHVTVVRKVLRPGRLARMHPVAWSLTSSRWSRAALVPRTRCTVLSNRTHCAAEARDRAE